MIFTKLGALVRVLSIEIVQTYVGNILGVMSKKIRKIEFLVSHKKAKTKKRIRHSTFHIRRKTKQIKANNRQIQSIIMPSDEKILKDLGVVKEKIELCNEIIAQAGGKVDSSDEALLGVIGFLEACESRMIELVEVAAQGSLQSDTLMRCLEVNDSLIKVLSICTGETAAEISPPATAMVAGKSKSLDNDLDLNDLILDDSNHSSPLKSPPLATGPVKSDPSDLDDLFGTPTTSLKAAAPPSNIHTNIDPLTTSPSTTPSSVPVKSNDDVIDEFDAFLQNRTSTSRSDGFFDSN